MIKVFISPSYGEDKGSNGGIARVVEAQRALLGQYDIEITDVVAEADILAVHAGALVRPVRPEQLLIASCHGLYWEEYSWDRWAIELNKEVIQVLKQSDACTAPSEWVANALRRGMWLDPVVINHGVDATSFTPGEGENLGYVFWNKSRVDPVCDVVPCEMLANMAGDVKFISTFGHRSSNLEVTGLLLPDKMKSLLQHAGVYLCNTRETFGIGTLEALACGVPVLGWNWGGQAEIIEHKRQGWLATPGDFDSLKEGLYYCLANRKELSIEARKLALEYTWDKAIAQYAELYHRTYEREHSRPRVSVIIRSHNQEALLPEAIQSVVKQQDEQNVEIIVVDDCSSDDSLKVAQANLDGRYNAEVVKTPENLGPAGALNWGVEHSNGKYVLVLDDDNLLGEGALDVLASALDADRTLDIAYGRMQILNGAISDWPPAKADLDAQLAHRNQIHSSAMYRRRIYDRVTGYRRRCYTGEDPDFWCRALSFGATGKKVTNAVTLIYRIRNDSVSNSSKDWPWEAWYPGFNLNYAAVPAPSTGRVSNVPSYEPVLISVIIPVGPGHEEIVIDAIDSISAQSFIKWECIVVNDSGQKLRLPSFVRYAETPLAGSGVAVARNMGLDLARGRCFVPLDADDYLDSKALEKLYAAYKKHGGYVYSDYRRIEELKVQEVPNQACSQVRSMLVHPITGLYPVLSELRFDESFVVGEDWDFVVGCTAMGYCGSRIPEPLVYYRTSSGSNRVKLLNDIELYRAKISRKYGGANMCGCQKGGNAVLTAAQVLENQLSSLNAQMPEGGPDLILLEFIPENTAPLTYRGRATGKAYRFGSGIDSIRYVDRRDAEYFLTRTEEFRLYDRDAALV